jgi:hypothetical protein
MAVVAIGYGVYDEYVGENISRKPSPVSLDPILRDFSVFLRRVRLLVDVLSFSLPYFANQ